MNANRSGGTAYVIRHTTVVDRPDLDVNKFLVVVGATMTTSSLSALIVRRLGSRAAGSAPAGLRIVRSPFRGPTTLAAPGYLKALLGIESLLAL